MGKFTTKVIKFWYMQHNKLVNCKFLADFPNFTVVQEL